MGVGGHAVPPLGYADGRVRYKFASFLNRNHVLRSLQQAANNYHAILEAEKKENEQSALPAHSSSVRAPAEGNLMYLRKVWPRLTSFNLSLTRKYCLACTMVLFHLRRSSFSSYDGSNFTNEYRAVRKDFFTLNMGEWHAADEYNGRVR